MLPPLDCLLNLSEIINLHITHENYTAAYSFTDENGRIMEVSHFEFAQAVHWAAHLLRPRRHGLDDQVVAIVALTDALIYQTIVAGCLIAGFVGSLGHLVDPVLVDFQSVMDPPYNLSVEEIPLLGQLYPNLGGETVQNSFVPYPGPDARIALDDVAFYLHSGGSTGLPKCTVPETHWTLIHFAALGALAEILEPSPRLAAGSLPPAYGFGVTMQFLTPILIGRTVCIYPPASTATKYIIPPIPTSQNGLKNAKRANVTGIMTVPSMILDWQSPEDIAYLKTLDVVASAYAGGALASGVRDSLFNQGVNIVPCYAGTEIGPVTLVKRHPAEVDAGEWAWEMGILNANSWFRLGLSQRRTKDLFERHPTKLDLWKIVDRLNDVLVMANGEKAVPGLVEDILSASQFIMGVVMFGRERNQIGVLIEPAEQYKIDPMDEQQVLNFQNLIWPVIEQANKLGHISTDTIEDNGNTAGDIEAPSSWSLQGLEPWLQTYASLVADRDILGGQDRSDQGFDSLNATFLRHQIVGALRNSDHIAAVQNIPQNFVYMHPTIVELTSAIMALFHGDANGCHNGRVAVEVMIAKYRAGFKALLKLGGNHIALSDGTFASSTGTVILLTSSMGGLGSHLLQTLLSLPSIQRVYAFNRGGRIPVSERQKEAFVDRGLDVALLASDKLIYLEGNTLQEGLGLPPDVWTTLCNTGVYTRLVRTFVHQKCDWVAECDSLPDGFDGNKIGARSADVSATDANWSSKLTE
ncbi:hypothetical protein K438DRAFT_1748528 [Mycena galopus ATCC 62051]|nr:hypothetical protein K438DRAFT_1748528 [Mycena galopus ATCC 62051]